MCWIVKKNTFLWNFSCTSQLGLWGRWSATTKACVCVCFSHQMTYMCRIVVFFWGGGQTTFVLFEKMKMAFPFVLGRAISAAYQVNNITSLELKIQPRGFSSPLSLQEPYWHAVILVNKSFWAEAILTLEDGLHVENESGMGPCILICLLSERALKGCEDGEGMWGKRERSHALPLTSP